MYEKKLALQAGGKPKPHVEKKIHTGERTGIISFRHSSTLWKTSNRKISRPSVSGVGQARRTTNTEGSDAASVRQNRSVFCDHRSDSDRHDVLVTVAAPGVAFRTDTREIMTVCRGLPGILVVQDPLQVVHLLVWRKIQYADRGGAT